MVWSHAFGMILAIYQSGFTAEGMLFKTAVETVLKSGVIRTEQSCVSYVWTF